MSAKQLTCATQMATHEGRIKELQEELTTAYKEKGKMAEDLLQAGAAIHACRDNALLWQPASSPSKAYLAAD